MNKKIIEKFDDFLYAKYLSCIIKYIKFKMAILRYNLVNCLSKRSFYLNI